MQCDRSSHSQLDNKYKLIVTMVDVGIGFLQSENFEKSIMSLKDITTQFVSISWNSIKEYLLSFSLNLLNAQHVISELFTLIREGIFLHFCCVFIFINFQCDTDIFSFWYTFHITHDIIFIDGKWTLNGCFVGFCLAINMSEFLFNLGHE